MKRQQIRNLILLIALLLFPLFMNFLSPYLIVNGAFEGILAGSGLVFMLLFIISLFTGRLFCSWFCPMGGLNECLSQVNRKRVTSKALKRTKFIIWGIWLLAIIGGFIFANGIKKADLLYMTDYGISVDQPIKYVTYYAVILLFAIISIIVGRRGSCHTICWIAPFMIAGKNLSDGMKLPRLKVKSSKVNCTHCNKCTSVCPMSIDVMREADDKISKHDDCILCGMCVDTCPKKCLSFQLNKL